MPASIGGYRWHAALDELTALRNCIATDLMGLGFTEARAEQDLSFEALTLTAFLDRRAIGQVDLVGNDTERGVSQIFAARYPDKVCTLTLTNCVDRWPNAVLRQFYGALQAGLVGETFNVMARDAGTAQAQLASVCEHPEIRPAATRGVFRTLRGLRQ